VIERRGAILQRLEPHWQNASLEPVCATKNSYQCENLSHACLPCQNALMRSQPPARFTSDFVPVPIPTQDKLTNSVERILSDAGSRDSGDKNTSPGMGCVGARNSEVAPTTGNESPHLSISSIPPGVCIQSVCILPVDREQDHKLPDRCKKAGCYRLYGHSLPHSSEMVTSRTLATQTDRAKTVVEDGIRASHRAVLSTMVALPSFAPPTLHVTFNGEESLPYQKEQTPPHHGSQEFLKRLPIAKIPAFKYPALDPFSRQIRIFKLHPRKQNAGIEGEFCQVSLEAPPPYIALSYTWGDAAPSHRATVGSDTTIMVRKNLWDFLHLQSSFITQAKLLWIHVIFVDQSNLREHNHQVSVMKEIYVSAREVYIWLGGEAEGSDRAMDYVKERGCQILRHKGLGYHSFWTREEGHAL
jgi:hypothetical protein